MPDGCDSDRMNAIWRSGGIAAALVGAVMGSGCAAAEQGGSGTSTAASGRTETAAVGQSEVQVKRSYWYAGFR